VNGHVVTAKQSGPFHEVAAPVEKAAKALWCSALNDRRSEEATLSIGCLFPVNSTNNDANEAYSVTP
jgi:hypothetical protein